ncbi:MAG TPA: hypothetical protein VIJ25_09535 [Methylococcales bacterium]|jgi:hypothetical protein
MSEELNPQPLPPGKVNLDDFVEAVTKGVSRAIEVRISDVEATSFRRPPIIIGIFLDPAALNQVRQEQ